MSTQYSLTVKNQSTQFGSFCVYQQAPDTNASNVLTLAWFAKTAHPTSSVTFTWNLDYNFTWGNQGNLDNDAVFSASQSWPCNPNMRNIVNFNKQGGAYTFSELSQNSEGDAGSLYISQLGGVVPREAHVGVGMSGSGTFIVEAQPNMKLIFRPKPTYYLVFGNYSQGQVMDVTSLSNVYKLEYGGSVQNISMVLNADNMWSPQ